MAVSLKICNSFLGFTKNLKEKLAKKYVFPIFYSEIKDYLDHKWLGKPHVGKVTLYVPGFRGNNYIR